MITYSIIYGEDDYSNALYKDDLLLRSDSEDYLDTETLNNILPLVVPEATVNYYSLDSEKCELLFNNEPYNYPDSFTVLFITHGPTLMTSHEPELV